MHRIQLYTYSFCYLVFSTLVHATPIPEHQKQLASFQTAQETVKNIQIQTTPTSALAKNVIFFLGDGMGVSTVTATRIWQGQQNQNTLGAEHQLSFDKFPYSGLMKTYNTTLQTPDSASTMTAMMTGVKTASGMLSITPAVSRKTCALKNQKLLSLLDHAKNKQKSVGIVSTARITHATPAALYAKISERNWESNDNIPKACTDQVTDIARQLVEHPYTIDVALGGGARAFVPADNTYNIEGKRTDGRDLIQAWRTRYGARAKFVQSKQELAQVTPENTATLLGLFSNGHMEYEAKRAATTEEPSLTEMTVKAIELLSTHTEGFFLMVEAARIDHAHHENHAAMAIMDTNELDKSVETTLKLLQDKGLLEDTLVIVAADHSHVVTFSGQSARGTPVLGLITDAQGNVQQAKDNLPYPAINYTNGPAADAHELNSLLRRDLNQHNTTDIDFRQPALLNPKKKVEENSETHGGEDVSMHARGPGAQHFSGNMEQNAVFHAISKAAGFDAKPYVTSTED